MNESKKTTFQILALYIISTTIFLGIIFGTWYFGEINALKIRSFREADKLSKQIIQVVAKRGKYARYINTLEGQRAVLQAISLDSEHRIMAFDKEGKLIYSSMKIDPRKIPQERGIFIVDDHIVLNSYGRPDFLTHPEEANSKHRHKRPDEAFRIVIDGGDIRDLLWDLRLKVWGLFGCMSLMMAIVGVFLVRLSLRPMNQKIEELDCFIKDTTHEINTPLSILQMSVERIKLDQIPQEEAKKLRHIQIASRTIENIYHSLVYTSFGRLEKRIEELDMQEVVQERLEFLSCLFEQKQISIITNLSSAWIMADRKALVLVIDNLLSNAYKYTPKGGEVQIILGEEEDGMFCMIKDNGYGIKDSDLEKIFDRYRRFDRSGGGFGLGLNIVQKICKECGIRLEVKSWHKKGSEFSLHWQKEQNTASKSQKLL
ncbi:sensor histidine kinase [Helicobacter pametensis]|uniref:sensor histidine kinase n=1 Tax=Helicobacter pametensis TaxID=95149 RepID=UPI00048291EC|nr:HAMP domain-containing sensor histidine kinase [Helicobacter pametensis]